MRRKPPTPRYAWIRELGPSVAESNGHIPAGFWLAVSRGRESLLPSQRAVFDLYRAGHGVAAIANELHWKKASVYKRLAEMDGLLRHRLRNYANSD